MCIVKIGMKHEIKKNICKHSADEHELIDWFYNIFVAVVITNGIRGPMSCICSEYLSLT